MSNPYPNTNPYYPYPKEQSNANEPLYPPSNYQQPPPSYDYQSTNSQPQQPGYQPIPPPPPPPVTSNVYLTPSSAAHNNNYPDGSGFGNVNSFSEKAIRHAFIRKVYGILTAQLAVTVAIIAIFIYVQPVKFFFKQNLWVLMLIIILSVTFVCIITCFDSLRRKHPWNLILLFTFTLLESILLGAVSASYIKDDMSNVGPTSNPVFLAAGLTSIVVIAVTIFAFQTKFDFTGYGIYLFVALILLIFFGLLCAIIRNDIMRIVYGGLGAGLFSMYLIYDTQLMMGGRKKYAISPEEHVLAALELYLDIINIFLYILQAFGKKN